MNIIICLTVIIGLSYGLPLHTYEINSDLAKYQNEHAKYSFSTDVKDNISDLSHEREEIRDGLNVRGRYAYSDGNIKYIVHYVADENGYRVTNQEQIKLPGPKVNPIGTASISTKTDNTELLYRVRSVPIPNGTVIY